MMFPLNKEAGWLPIPSSVNFFALSLGFMILEQGFEFYLMKRQRNCLKKKEPPQELIEEAAAVDKRLAEEIQNKFTSSRDYNLDKNSFGMFSDAYTMVVTTSTLLLGMGPFLMEVCKKAVTVLMPSYANEYSISAALLLMKAAIQTILVLPVSYYSTFVVEEKHGFNKMSVGLFFSDALKNCIVSTLITLPLTLATIKVIRMCPEYFFVYVWGLLLVFSLAMISIYPNFIMPLFNKYEPLKNKELAGKINNLAKEVSFPLTKIFQVDGSKRSAHSNAYLYGFFWDKRIVLYDTLFTGEKDNEHLVCEDEEVVAILAHELGHWKRSHTLKGFVLNQFVILCMLRMFSEFINNSSLYNQFGYVRLDSGEYPVFIGISLFGMLFTPVNSVLLLVVNALTRRFEYEADEFALGLGRSSELKRGLLKISISNLSSFNVDPLFRMFHHSHPTLLQRLTRLRSLEKKES